MKPALLEPVQEQADEQERRVIFEGEGVAVRRR